MKMTDNTILITGGGSGIGRGLAEAFLALGNTVVIAGRRESVLRETVAANPGMEMLVLDASKAESVATAAAELRARFPKLNVLINNAGIMKTENLLDAGAGSAAAEETVTTNLLAPIWVTGALLPLLREQEAAVVMTVTSGLAFVPLSLNPAYCATKAAIHSWTQSLRFQLRTTKVEVLELIPPYVQTYLAGERQANDPKAMPLSDYIAEVMEILTTQPEATEICVKRVLPLRNAAEAGREKYEGFFVGFNEQMVVDRS